jgi:hypothetical protein
MSADDPRPIETAFGTSQTPVGCGRSPAPDQIAPAGLVFWGSVWLGTTLAGGLFGLLLDGWAGLAAGLIIAGVVALPVHVTCSTVTWCLRLTRIRAVMATFSGGATGVLATCLLGRGQFTAELVIAAACGGFGSGAAGFLHHLWVRRQGRGAEVSPSPPVTGRDLLLRLAVLAFVIATWLGIVASLRLARQLAHQRSCTFQLKAIWLSLENYATSHQHYPPAWSCDERGRAIQSWRAHLMPYLGHYSFDEYYALSEPWDSPKNRGYTDRPIEVFVCPRQRREGRRFTNYVAVVGPETMWPGAQSARPDEVVNRDAIFVVEYPDSDIPWGEPRDLTVEEFLALLEARWSQRDFGPHPNGLLYVTVAGDIRALGRTINLETVRQLLKARKAQPPTSSDAADQ